MVFMPDGNPSLPVKKQDVSIFSLSILGRNIPTHICTWYNQEVQSSPGSHLDVSTREVIFSHDQVVQCHVIGQRHSACVDLKDALLGLFIRQRELDLPVNAACMQVERLSGTPLCSPPLCLAQEEV